jgi:hypothetical protein
MALDDGVNAMFYLSVLTLLCSSIALSIKYCYKSKCKTCEFCSFLKITRDVDVEKQEDLSVMQANKSDDKIASL